MKVYGADFSGARNPSKGIYYAEGSLNGQTLQLERVVHCDDRLDLLAAIHFSKAPWGLDFPFSIPVKALEELKLKSWAGLLNHVVESGRAGFDKYLENGEMPGCEVKCRGSSICCRFADAAVQAFSPLKKSNPNMRMMTYAGLKLLSHLRKFGNAVYPFDPFKQDFSRLYEVYPSHTWKQVGLSRGTNLGPFVELFYKRYGLKVKFEKHQIVMDNLDAADAVVACVTMAYALEHFGLEDDRDCQQDWISKLEWNNRHQEGLIVKVD